MRDDFASHSDLRGTTFCRFARTLPGQMLIAMLASTAFHVTVAAAALVIGIILLPRITVSEAGRNSISLVASIERISPLPDSVEMIIDVPVPRWTKPSDRTTTVLETKIAPIATRWSPQTPNLDRPAAAPPFELVEISVSGELPTRADVISETTQLSASRPPPLPRAEVSPELKVTAAASAPSSQASPSSAASQGAEVDELPKPVYNPAPVYPADALRRGLAGRVVLAVTVNTTGNVTAAEVHTTSGHAQLDRAALDRVKQWQFEPARFAGLPIIYTVAVPVKFVMPGSSRSQSPAARSQALPGNAAP